MPLNTSAEQNRRMDSISAYWTNQTRSNQSISSISAVHSVEFSEKHKEMIILYD